MSKTPKLRFKEFSGDWEEKKLGDLGNFIKGKGISTSDTSDEGLPAMMYGDIYIKYNISFQSVDYRIPVDVAEKSTSITKGNLLFTCSGETAIEIGKCVSYQGDNTIYIGGDILSLLPHNSCSMFLAQQQNTYMQVKQKARLGQGNSVVHIYEKHLSGLKLAIPSCSEQTKIADFLTLVDNKIAKQDEKVKTLEQYKKGLMQKIFSQELRFKDDSGQGYPKWMEKKLREVVEFFNGKGHENIIDSNGTYVVVNSKFVSTCGSVIKKSNKQLCPLNTGDIVMVMSDVPNGKAIAKCYYIDADDKYTLNQRIGCFRAMKNDSKFIYYFLNRNRYYLKFDDGVNQTNLKKEDVLRCPIQLPVSEEQIKIANLLSKFDEKIEKEKEKLEQLKMYKQGLLQQIFV